tara:strand:+ start:349 stop:603 length:255 start_codon:yes stop_codon:yes gene_type:complete
MMTLKETREGRFPLKTAAGLVALITILLTGSGCWYPGQWQWFWERNVITIEHGRLVIRPILGPFPEDATAGTDSGAIVVTGGAE